MRHRWPGLPERPRIAPWVLAVLVLAGGASAEDRAEIREKVADRLESAATVVSELLAAPDKGLPRDLLDRAACVVVIPSMKKAGLGVGGRYGRGVTLCRRAGGTGAWGPPSMTTMAGGSIGLQIGVSAVDVVMLVLNTEAIRPLLDNEFTLGGDASIAAGPVGRAGTAETDAFLRAKILTWSRSRGVFAGLEIKGATLSTDEEANLALYGFDVPPKEILIEGKLAVPREARPLTAVLFEHSPKRVEGKQK